MKKGILLLAMSMFFICWGCSKSEIVENEIEARTTARDISSTANQLTPMEPLENEECYEFQFSFNHLLGESIQQFIFEVGEGAPINDDCDNLATCSSGTFLNASFELWCTPGLDCGAGTVAVHSQTMSDGEEINMQAISGLSTSASYEMRIFLTWLPDSGMMCAQNGPSAVFYYSVNGGVIGGTTVMAVNDGPIGGSEPGFVRP